MLYEMVTGQRPFQGDTKQDVATAIAQREPDPPRNLNPAVSPSLEAVIRQALAKAPAARFGTAAEMILALEERTFPLPQGDEDRTVPLSPGDEDRTTPWVLPPTDPLLPPAAWPMWGGGPTHAGVSPVSIAPPLREVWRTSVGGRLASVSASPERIAVGSLDGEIVVLDAATRTVIARQTCGGAVMGTPALVGPVAYVGNAEGLWRIGSDQPFVLAPKGAVDSSPAIAAGRLYVGSHDRHLYALDLEPDGELTWRWQARTGGPILSSPAVAGDRVFVGSQDGFLYAFDADTGDRVWRFRTGGPVNASPTVAVALVYVGSSDGWFYALKSAGQGGKPALAWKYNLHAPTQGAPAVFGGRVYVTTGGVLPQVVWLEVIAGQPRRVAAWRPRGEGGRLSAPAVDAAGRLFVAFAGDYEAKVGSWAEPPGLFVLRTEGGAFVEETFVPTEQALFATPALTAQGVILATEGGFIHGFAGTTGSGTAP
jgi:outer membrane protein assembly factor BamB